MSRIHFSSYNVFKSFSKKIQKISKAEHDFDEPVPLGTIRSICAYGFGYRNDHDLQQSITSSRQDSLNLLTTEQRENIKDRLYSLAKQKSSVIGVKSLDNWYDVIFSVFEATNKHFEQISILTKTLHVMGVNFIWPLSPNGEGIVNLKVISDVVESLKKMAPLDWKFMPSCSSRGIPDFADDYENEESTLLWDDLQYAINSSDDDFSENVVKISNEFNSDPQSYGFEKHLETGLKIGSLFFVAEVNIDNDVEELEPGLSVSKSLNKNIQKLVNELVGYRCPWISIMPPVFSYVQEYTQNHYEFNWTFISGLSEIANNTQEPSAPKESVLLTQGVITGRILFNNKKADIYLPNYDTFLNCFSADYDVIKVMYAQATSNIYHQCEGLEISRHAHPSHWVRSVENIEDHQDIFKLDSAGGFELPENSEWTLENGALINCPRYLKGHHIPDFNTELMYFDFVTPRPNESFFECSVNFIKALKPTQMTAIAYIETDGGLYFHVVVRIYSNKEIIAEESYSVYEGSHHNGLFARGDVLYDRLESFANRMNIPFVATSSEDTYYYGEVAYGDAETATLVFRGADIDTIQSNSRIGILLTVLHKEYHDQLTVSQCDLLRDAIKMGVLSSMEWGPEIIQKNTTWNIDRAIRFLDIPIKCGFYEKHMADYCDLLMEASANNSNLDIKRTKFDRIREQYGHFAIGFSIDGTATVLDEILNELERVSISEAIVSLSSENTMSEEEIEEKQQYSHGLISPFYIRMEAEIRSILNLSPEAKLRMTFTKRKD